MPVLLRSDSLTPLEWNFRGSLPALERPLGVDRDDRTAWFLSSKGALIGIDLNARNTQIRLTGGKGLTAASDGYIFGFDTTGRPIRFANHTVTHYRGKVSKNPVQLFRAPGGLVALYTAADRILQVLSDEGEVRRFDVPGGQATASWFGDLIAISNDSGITFVKQTPTRNQVDFKRLRGAPIQSVFSPSEHRLYVALANGRLAIVDGLGDHATLGTIDLDHRIEAMRTDRSGRWLLLKPELADSLWVLDLVSEQVVSRMATTWEDDLPDVVDGVTLLIRQGKDIVAWSLSQNPPVEKQRIRGAASDFLIPVYWSPSRRLPTTAPVSNNDADTSRMTTRAASDSDQVTTAKDTRTGATDDEWYIQVSSSQNPEYARTLADQLREEGYPARVISPVRAEQGYRVIMGPYSSYEQADTTGKRLGRAYFVMTLGGPDPER